MVTGHIRGLGGPQTYPGDHGRSHQLHSGVAGAVAQQPDAACALEATHPRQLRPTGGRRREKPSQVRFRD
jgi:hypothetical protein